MSIEAKQIAITSPCPITLDRSGVSAQDKAMFCAHCTKDVHLLSQMTESEARELMQEQAGRDICVSYAIRSNGSIRFRPDPQLIPARALTRRPAPVPATVSSAPRRRMSLAAAVGASLLLAACTPHGEEQVVGAIEAAPVVEQPELLEVIPCEEPDPPLPVAGGLRAEPLPEPEEMVDGGLVAEPLPEPEPKADKPTKAIKTHKRGKIRARSMDDHPLVDL